MLKDFEITDSELAELGTSSGEKKTLCPFCEERYSTKGNLCKHCADLKGDRADRAAHLNRCDW